MMGEIQILTGPIRSGKTTSLEKLAHGNSHTKGIICPDIDGCRHVRFIEKGVTKRLEIDESYINTISIGRFYFDQAVMHEVSDYLHCLEIQEDDLIVVDEVGKLELRGQGFEPGLTTLITSFKNSGVNATLLLVVRDYLLDEVIHKYELTMSKIHTKEQLM